jgi:YgiT-type zinc finger domain-containing protein
MLKKCPMCGGGALVRKKVDETMFGVKLGRFPAWVCNRCGESFTDENTTQSIIDHAKQKGIWGLGKKVKVVKSGNSLVVRIPKEIADFMKLEKGQELFIRPDGKSKITVEV